MRKRVVWLRRVSQLLFLALFLLLFGLAGRAVLWGLPADLFLRADPLIALSSALSLREATTLLWYAVPVVVMSLLLGRVFCGWVCPMGTVIDLCERVLHLRGRPPARAPRWRRVKFYVLIAILTSALVPVAHRSAREVSVSGSLGLSAAYVADPIAFLTRTVTLGVLPPTQFALTFGRDLAATWAYSPVAERRAWLQTALDRLGMGLGLFARPDSPPYFRLGLAALAVFGAVVALGSLARRFWCRNLCPLGALLAVLGRMSPLRLAVSDRCTRCGRCVNECKMGALTEGPAGYLGAECIWCTTCLARCPQQAISAGLRLRPARASAIARVDRLDLERRHVLGAVGLGIAAAIMPKADWSARRTAAGEKALKLSSERLIRPPGARAEDEFVTACIRCGECMKVCPTNGLQPALGEGGIEALGTPILVPRLGPCADYCHACGDVCPTGAIRPIKAEEKAHLYLGTARVDRSLCIAWAFGRQCMVCQEACPYGAIAADFLAGVPRPVVDHRICVGCGMCEFRCPVEPRAAIRVSAGGDRRHLSRAEQAALRKAAGSRRPDTGGEEAPKPEGGLIDQAP